MTYLAMDLSKGDAGIVLERDLIHAVDKTQFTEQEVEDAATRRN